MCKWWYRDHCPGCKGEGELVVVRGEGGKLRLQCAECGVLYDSRDWAEAPESAYLSEVDDHELPSAMNCPTDEEIVANGWQDMMAFSIENAK